MNLISKVSEFFDGEYEVNVVRSVPLDSHGSVEIINKKNKRKLCFSLSSIESDDNETLGRFFNNIKVFLA